jgi:hypothetical protein
MLVIMLVTQLYGYEEFAAVLAGVLPSNDSRAHQALAAVIVVTELMALPYLLRMLMSRLLRVLSASLAFLVSGFWLLSALTNAHAQNSGLFAGTISLPGGLLAAFWSLGLTGLVVAVIIADSRFRHVSP